MAKKKQTSRGSRPRRPKRIISGITEFIDDDWWEDSSRPSRDKESREKTGRGRKSKSSDESAEQEPTSTTAKKRKPAKKAEPVQKKAPKKPAKKKATHAKQERATEEEEVAEPKARPKRKRSRRRKQESEPVVETDVRQEPITDEPTEAPKKKRRRRSRSRTDADKTPVVETAPQQVPEPEEPSSEKPKRRRRRSAKKETLEVSQEATPRKKAAREDTAAEPRPKRRRRKVAAEAEEAPREEQATKPKRRRRKVAAEVEARETPREEQAAKPKRSTKKTEVEAEEPAAKPRRRRKVAAEAKATPQPQKKPARETAPVEKETPAAKKEPKKKRVSEKRAPKKRAKSSATTGFGAMDLSEDMLEALELAGYSEPTPIQAGLIAAAIKGNDLMGQAQTGTGKTAAFAIPLLETVDYETEHRGPQALVMVPTRELAVQVRDECAKLASTGDIQVVAVYGGKPIRQQIDKLRRCPEIVVGTPGRVIDLNARGALFFGDIRQVVLDEADRMLDIGFRPDIEKILRRCPESRQTLLLSATLPGPVLRLAQRYMRDPEVLDFSPANIAVETIEQFYFTVDPERKFDLLLKLIERENPTQAIVFCRTRRGTEKIYRRLSRQNLEGAACIHGDLTQSARDATMRKFRSGKLRILVATDVIGRGIDVSSVSHIINYDIPAFCDDYVHRVGRTGRMGREGVAYSFISPEEGPELTRIEMRINTLLQRAEMPGFDMGIKDVVPEEGGQPPESKPVYGRPKRRVRRAL